MVVIENYFGICKWQFYSRLYLLGSYFGSNGVLIMLGMNDKQCIEKIVISFVT